MGSDLVKVEDNIYKIFKKKGMMYRCTIVTPDSFLPTPAFKVFAENDSIVVSPMAGGWKTCFQFGTTNNMLAAVFNRTYLI